MEQPSDEISVTGGVRVVAGVDSVPRQRREGDWDGPQGQRPGGI